MTTVAEVLALPYVSYDDRRQLPNAAGVYCAIIDRTTVAYVGQTGSLRKRWYCHQQREVLAQLGDLSIAYVVTEAGVDPVPIERAMIAALRPPVNVKHAGEATVHISLTLPERDTEDLDRIARRRGISRSALICEAILDWLDRNRPPVTEPRPPVVMAPDALAYWGDWANLL